MEADKIVEWFKLGIMVATVLTGFIYGSRKLWKFMSIVKYKKSEEKFNQVNATIRELLSEVRIFTKASRVSICQFHNGGKFMDGASMRKMSISHYSCDPRTPPTAVQYKQDILVSRYAEILEMLRTNDPKIHLVDEMHESNTKNLCIAHDVYGLSVLPIYCSDSMLVYGYISLEWCDSETLAKVDSDSLRPYLQGVRNQISFLLCSSKTFR
jgi:hypothetical protein